MRTISIMAAAVFFLAGCTPSAEKNTSPEPPAQGQVKTPGEAPEQADITVIRMVLEPMGTFEIDGTDVKGVALEDLAKALAAHGRDHPGAEYEVYSEVKRPPDGPGGTDEIIETIRGLLRARKYVQQVVEGGSLVLFVGTLILNVIALRVVRKYREQYE